MQDRMVNSIIQVTNILTTVSPLYLWVPHSSIQQTVDQKYSKKRKIPETSQKQNLNLVHPGNYLHSIYVVLGIISYLEMT